MAYIQINSIALTPTPPGIITVTVAYKVATNPDVPASYTTYGVYSVNPDGTFVGGALFINGLNEGVQYTVHIYAECFGAKANFIPFPGANGTSTTTTIPSITVNWSFTNNGENINDYYYIYVQNSTGSDITTEILNNVNASGTFYPPSDYFLWVSNGGGGTLDTPNYHRVRLYNETDAVLVYDYIQPVGFTANGQLMSAGKVYTLTVEMDIVTEAPPTTTTTSTTTTLFCPEINNIFINAASS